MCKRDTSVTQKKCILQSRHFKTMSYAFLCRYLDAGRDMVASLQYSARCPCGFCHISDVEFHKQEDHMESFFLAETVKTRTQISHLHMALSRVRLLWKNTYENLN